jgi:serine/threonine-protein kinase
MKKEKEHQSRIKYIGRYEICGRLGQGGMASVYKAKAPITERRVALKLLKPRSEIFEELAGREGLQQLFVDEARVMGEISHEHVARVVDCDFHNGTPFIVLEYYGRSLGAIIGESYDVEQASRILSPVKSTRYALQTLRGLERLHFAGIIHRDIKPYNLMLTNDDSIKVIDFGLSRVRGEDMHIPGMQVGSPHYAAPEQIKNSRDVDGRADIFSVGVMLYRMLTGNLPRWKNGQLVPATFLNTTLHKSWDALLKKSLSRDVSKRFATSFAMQQALVQLGKESFATVSQGLQMSPSGQKRTLRSEPVRIMYRDICRELGLDTLMRPSNMVAVRLDLRDDDLACDTSSGLCWQRRGAGFGVTWKEAAAYVDHLNETGWKNRRNWRLPTTEELVSILPVTWNGVHSDTTPTAIFDGSVPWLWSADVCTKKQAWCVDLKECFVERLAKDATAYVCAVASD